MEKIIKIALLALIIVLGYFLYDSIAGPIKEAQYVDKVYNARLERLKDIKDAQKAYKDVTDSFANNWDSLTYVLTHGKYKLIRQMGDPEDTNSVVTFDTAYVSVIDSMYDGNAKVLDSLRWLPYSATESEPKKTYTLNAGWATKDGAKIRVFEVKEPEPYIKKDNQLYIGSMYESTYKGSWE